MVVRTRARSRAHKLFKHVCFKKFLLLNSFYALLLLSIHKRSALTKNRLSESFLLFSQHTHTHALKHTTNGRKNTLYIAFVHIELCRCVCVNNRNSESISIIQMFVCKARTLSIRIFVTHSIILAETSVVCQFTAVKPARCTYFRERERKRGV